MAAPRSDGFFGAIEPNLLAGEVGIVDREPLARRRHVFVFHPLIVASTGANARELVHTGSHALCKIRGSYSGYSERLLDLTCWKRGIGYRPVMFENLANLGFDIAIRNHAAAILSVDFEEVLGELESALLDVAIPAEELIGSGGGEAQSTQRLRRKLYEAGWPKHNFDFRLIVDGSETVSTSHEIDHVRRADAGVIACEIEWNNKDPFFDRDLENFQRLHGQSAISAGVLITRGASMQEDMHGIVERCIKKHGFLEESEMVEAFGMKDRTKRQREAVQKHIDRQVPFAEAFARQFVSDKFGAATTHWSKLEDRINRGVGNPCPLLLIGLPKSVIIE